MRIADLAALYDFVSEISFEDEGLFRRRQAIVRDLGFDEATVEAHFGFLAVDRVCFSGRRFDRDIKGVEPQPAVIIGALDEGETLVDLVAWPLDDPAVMATLLGRAVMLGEHQAWAYPFSTLSPPLPVFRTGLAWLRAGCVGCVPLDRLRFASLFLDVGGQILAEDDAHGADLDDARQEIIARGASIVVRAA